MNVFHSQSPGAWVLFILISLCIVCFVLPRLLEIVCFILIWTLDSPYAAWYHYSIWLHRQKRVCPQPTPPFVVEVVAAPPPAVVNAQAADVQADDAPEDDEQGVAVPPQLDIETQTVARRDAFGPI
jgi:hypothetical protein